MGIVMTAVLERVSNDQEMKKEMQAVGLEPTNPRDWYAQAHQMCQEIQTLETSAFDHFAKLAIMRRLYVGSNHGPSG
jgi:hypothetical protein